MTRSCSTPPREARCWSASVHPANAWTADLQVDVHDELLRYRLEQRFCVLAWDLLALGVNVVLELGLWGYDERELLRRSARARGFPVELRCLEVAFDDDTRSETVRRPGLVTALNCDVTPPPRKWHVTPTLL